MNNALPRRKPNRLKGYDYSFPGSYFITICTENCRNLFWNRELNTDSFHWLTVGANCVRPQNLPLSNIGEIVCKELEVWQQTYPAVHLNAFVIMPNHLHILLSISALENGRTQFAPTISRMVKQFKGAITKQLHQSIWQKSFFEHIIRDDNDYITKLTYLCENPLRWNLDEFNQS